MIDGETVDPAIETSSCNQGPLAEAQQEPHDVG